MAVMVSCDVCGKGGATRFGLTIRGKYAEPFVGPSNINRDLCDAHRIEIMAQLCDLFGQLKVKGYYDENEANRAKIDAPEKPT